MRVEGHLLDVDYVIEEDVPVLRLVLQTDDGPVLARYTEFEPYLYVVPADGAFDECRERLEGLSFEANGDTVEVRRVEERALLDGTEERDVLQVFVQVPPDVPKVKDEVKDWDEVGYLREFDIPFYKRFLINKGLKPPSLVAVEGEATDGAFDGTVVAADAVEQVDDRDVLDSSYLAFDLEVYDDRIIMCSFYGEGFRKVLVLGEDGIGKDYVETVPSEPAMLDRIMEIVDEQDPDVVTGYNTDEFDFDVLRDRCEEHGKELKLGRMDERMTFRRRGRFSGAKLKGRVHLDLYAYVETVVSMTMQSETLTLDSVAEELLGENKDEMDWEDIRQAWEEKEDLDTLAKYALRDSELAYKLAESLVPQIVSLSVLTGLVPFDTCRTSYGQLVENYMIRQAYDQDRLVPNRPTQGEIGQRHQEGGYAGGFVYEPEKGLHEDIALFDFRSLYPTIIVSHNISPDVLDVEDCEDEFTVTVEPDDEEELSPAEREGEDPAYTFCQDVEGFIPGMLRDLIEERYEIKSKLPELDEDSQAYRDRYNRQYALKTLSNAFYGYLGYASARWYSRPCAEATTYLGREYIHDTIDIAEEMGFEVVYGDSVDYDRRIILRNSEGETEFWKIGRFVEEGNDVESYETLAFDVDEQRAVFRPVKNAVSHDFDDDVLRFKTIRGQTIVTPQHSVYSFQEGEIRLVDARELEEGDYLVSLTDPPSVEPRYEVGEEIDVALMMDGSEELRAYPDTRRFAAKAGTCPYCGEEYENVASHVSGAHDDRKEVLSEVTDDHIYIGGKNAKTGRIPRYWEMDKEFAWILGYFAADGSVSLGEKEMISFGSQERRLIDRVKEFFDTWLDTDLEVVESVDDRTGNVMYYYRVQRKPLARFFVEGLGVGKGSRGKKVPKVILNGEKKLKRAFIEGYTEGDGSITSEHDDRYDVPARRFSTASTDLAAQVQYLLKQLEFEENDYGRAMNDVSFKYRQDKPEVASIRTTTPVEPPYHRLPFTPARITEIERVEPTKRKVYDLEVEGDHNFVDAEGLMLVHNTDSVFIKGEDVAERPDEFQERVNETLPEFMELELEGMFERGLFTYTASGEGAKKKYALIDEDGDIKVTGFEQVRRDWSKLAKETQKQVIRQVLEDDVDGAVQTVKDTIQRLKEGGVPVEELKIYTSLTKKPENYDSKAPHVEAAKRAIDRGVEISPGDTIDYVVTSGAGTISDRAELTQFAEDYDAQYYIDNQIIPVSLRVLKVFGYTEGQLKGKGKQSGLGRFAQ
ncbi:MAG: DNA polymerase domain-containing protein [Candidatus Nanohaloarchaea archaeon]|nr:DNA polymerase domain-containing protein [Candidatus Nanohaloarchaea archaeon]